MHVIWLVRTASVQYGIPCQATASNDTNRENITTRGCWKLQKNWWAAKTCSNTVKAIVKRYKRSNTFENKPGCGRARNLTAQTVRHLHNLVLKNRRASARHQVDEASTIIGEPVSARTVCRAQQRWTGMDVVREENHFWSRCTKLPDISLQKSINMKLKPIGGISCGLTKQK